MATMNRTRAVTPALWGGLWAAIATICLTAALAAAGGAWPWSGSYGDQAVSLLIIGDIQVQRRADPASAFVHLRETLE
ncbi:MAG: hypothetical protein HYX76_05205, partial [Acidobacteria bacterium]|nr:hypothetical protein [Acidobacteriota bacterium]